MELYNKSYNKFNILKIDDDSDDGDWQTINNSKNKSLFLKKYNKKDNKNFKKMLCENMVNTGICNYNNRCNYAHNINEQIIDTFKKDAYEIIQSVNIKYDIDLQKNLILYKSFLSLTKMCENCAKGKCTGGLNCKFGACSKIYKICFNDLNYGNCIINCDLVHITKKGINPFYITNINFNSNSNTDVNSDDELSGIFDNIDICNPDDILDMECYQSIFE
jgi:hypothetical protein